MGEELKKLNKMTEGFEYRVIGTNKDNSKFYIKGKDGHWRDDLTGEIADDLVAEYDAENPPTYGDDDYYNDDDEIARGSVKSRFIPNEEEPDFDPKDKKASSDWKDKWKGAYSDVDDADDDFYSRDSYFSKWAPAPKKVREPSAENANGTGVLVIHMKDTSTNMLKLVYKDKGYDVITDGSLTPDEIYDEIEKHAKIIMLGHGSGWGLMNPGHGGHIIDEYHAPVLKTKETVSIWCHSDDFFRAHGMHGFHTGMIISEVGEAKYVLGKTPLNKEETLRNMINFAKIVGECIEKTPEEMKEYVLAHYVGDDEVTQYNRKNIIVL